MPPHSPPTPAHLPPPRRTAFAPPDLKGLARRSYCCNGLVYHSYAWDAKPSRRALLLECGTCHHRITNFRVVNRAGEQIWPVLCAVRVSRRHFLVSGTPATVFHPPRRSK